MRKKLIVLGIVIILIIVGVFLIFTNKKPAKTALATSNVVTKPAPVVAKVENTVSTTNVPKNNVPVVNTNITKPIISKPNIEESNGAILKSQLLGNLNIAQEKVNALNNSPEASKSSYSIVSTEKSIYNIWNTQLNLIYQKVLLVLSPNQRETLQNSEIAWIKSKEASSSNFASRTTPGSLGYGMRYLDRQNEMTKERCFYIIENYLP